MAQYKDCPGTGKPVIPIKSRYAFTAGHQGKCSVCGKKVDAVDGIALKHSPTKHWLERNIL